MERATFLRRSKSDSFSSTLSTKDARYFLPPPVHQKPKIRVRALLGHCLYRRVIIWSVAGLFLLCLGLSTTGGVGIRRGGILDMIRIKTPPPQDAEKNSEAFMLLLNEAMDNAAAQEEGESNLPSWLQFKHLDGYFNGLKALVPLSDYTPEYPRDQEKKSPFPLTSSEYTSKYHKVETCYLDKDKTIPVPDLYAYDGVVQGQPEPVIGSHNVLGLREDVCFDRFGRYGPYGLGYSFDEGGVEAGMDTEQEGSGEVWAKTGKINYDRMDWGDAQDRCFQSNKKRFNQDGDGHASTYDSQLLSAEDTTTSQHQASHHERKKIPRTAIIIRTYVGFQWTRHSILNFRAMISELSLRSGGEYAVHFLLHVRDDEAPVWADGETAQRVLDENVPDEFHSICTLWSEAQMRLLYPGTFGRSVENPSNDDIHGVYRSAHMPLQHFAITHPQYAYYWNWEMDMRWLGNYYELFDRLGIWARDQSRVEMWERASKYYIPHYHGSWDNFTELVHNETVASGRRPIMGPVMFAGRTPIRSEERGETFLPASCAPAHGGNGGGGEMSRQCGVGEDADLITLNPLFDTEDSGWIFAQDVTGYNTGLATPPRRCAIVTASRLSRRLLETMHEETWRLHHGMFSEMFPASMALHHGLKAVYAPHPVYLDREWDLGEVERAFNGGRDGSSGGRGSPFDFENEHNHKGSTWYYNSEFAGLLWRRGGGVEGGQGGGGGRGMGGKGTGTGRLCLRSVLVHPVKWEHPNE
ncbi:hypothetical protein B0T17DRAFT_624651 [Bombardia bombarda]|uniref:Major facilitator superfamily transporter n=1 Tax=Bombardia bombarda TaxID=252184 RepID=A0AA39XKW9_9PEZI|nr:hypothetical protein B0T17DRAFT_624651 [Bombardia bombarda]